MNTTTLLTAAASLAAVLLLVLGAGRLARTARFARMTGLGGAPGKRLQLRETLAIDPRRRLLLVQCDNRCVVLLVGAQDQVVGWLPDAPP
jgi:flagellar protein FliO/FliZ